MQRTTPQSEPSPLVAGYLTAELPGTGGEIRQTPEDFNVAEIPLYGPSGSGQHTLFEIEKRGIDTPRAVRELARALQVSPRLIGSAGLKDAHAVTRQQLSVEGVPPERVRAVTLPNVRVLWAERHRNRLKIGHLRGNRFVIRVRGVPPDALERARAVLSVLERRGVPNSYGPQRFGVHGSTHLLGRALVRGELPGFLSAFLRFSGDLGADPEPAVQQALAAEDWRGALALWPAEASYHRRVLEVLTRGNDPEAALRQVHSSELRFFVAAYQASLFNRVLAPRLSTLDQLEPGDLALKHANGACFLVEDAAAEQPRAAALEISPTGPLFGYKMRSPQGEPGRREQALLEAEGLTSEAFRLRGLHLEGERRPLRVPLSEASARWEEGLVLEFSLPAGAYATNVVREVTKVG